MDYHKLRVRVTVDEVEGLMRGKIDFQAHPTDEYIAEVLKPAVTQTTGCAEITRCNLHDARFLLRFSSKVKQPEQMKAVAREYENRVNSRIDKLVADGNAIIEDWLHGRQDLSAEKDSLMATPTLFGIRDMDSN